MSTFISFPPADNRLEETPASSYIREPAEVNWNEREMRSSTEEQSLPWTGDHGRQRIEDQGKSQEKSRGKLWTEERLGVEGQKTIGSENQELFNIVKEEKSRSANDKEILRREEQERLQKNKRERLEKEEYERSRKEDADKSRKNNEATRTEQNILKIPNNVNPSSNGNEDLEESIDLEDSLGQKTKLSFQNQIVGDVRRELVRMMDVVHNIDNSKQLKSIIPLIHIPNANAIIGIREGITSQVDSRISTPPLCRPTSSSSTSSSSSSSSSSNSLTWDIWTRGPAVRNQQGGHTGRVER